MIYIYFLFFLIAITEENESVNIELDGFYSLEYLKLNINRFSMRVRNVPSLKHLVIECEFFNESLSKRIFENLPNIKELELNGVFSDINLNDLVNLEKLKLTGKIFDQNFYFDNLEKKFFSGQIDYNFFNFGLFENLCNQLEELSIDISNIDDEMFSQLFYDQHFSRLKRLHIMNSEITKLEKEIFEGFPMLQYLSITGNKRLREIDTNVFSNLKNSLKNLDLRCNNLTYFDLKILDKTASIEKINLTGNSIINQDEIMRRVKDSKIHFHF